MTKILYCTVCEARLTPSLMVMSSKAPGIVPPKQVCGKQLTARGVAFKSWVLIEKSFADEPALLEDVPQYWLNPDDLAQIVGNNRKKDRLSGCCGIAGIGGPNQICGCGAETGTLRTDSWTPHLFVPDPAHTNWIEE